MSTPQLNWKENWPTDNELQKAIEDFGSVSAVVAASNVGRNTIDNHIKGKRRQVAGQPILKGPRNTEVAKLMLEPSLEAERKTIEIGKDTASATFTEATLDPNEVPTDKQLLKRANLDPELWEVATRRTSVWEAQGLEGEVKTLRSLKVSYSKRKDKEIEALLPAFGGRPITVRPPTRRKATARDTELVMIMSDFHAPYHDERLLDVACEVLRENQPQRLIINGDLVDFPTAGRHRKTTNKCRASANECIQVGGDILAKLRSSVSEDCVVSLIPGNHDGWLSNFLIDQAGPAYELCVSGSDLPVWSLRNLLQLDALNIEMVGEEDQWQAASIKLSDYLVVKHGHSVRQGSAASVLANMKNSGHAAITGHTHRMGVASKTVWGADGSHKVIQGAEIGGMYKMPETPQSWPTYTAHSSLDWQPGFCSVELEKDGHYSIDLASWQNGVLMYRGNRYQ